MALMAIISSDLPLMVSFVLFCSLIFWFVLSQKNQAKPHRKLVTLSCSNYLVWSQIFQDGSRRQAKLISYYRTRWLIMLELKSLVDETKYRIPLPKDSMSPDEYRKLCIKLWRG